MTESTLDRESHTESRFTEPASKTIAFVFMTLGLFLSVILLNWAVTNKLSKIKPTAGSEVTAAVRERQLECLAQNIYHEAGNQPFEGKVAVAQVTINRTESGQFPSDICKVVYQKNLVYDKVLCQFSWYCQQRGGIKPKNEVVYEQSMEAAKKVLLEGFRLPGLTTALYFHADYIHPGWNRKKVAHIGQHIFYE